MSLIKKPPQKAKGLIKMKRLVEISIDFNNPNEKLIVDIFKIESINKNTIKCPVDDWNRKHRHFDDRGLGCVSNHTPLHFYYRFVTSLEDYQEIIKSTEMKLAVEILWNRINYILTYWNRSFLNRSNYIEKVMGIEFNKI